MIIKPLALLLAVLLALTIGACTGGGSYSLPTPSDPRLVSMPPVSREQAADFFQDITTEPFALTSFEEHEGQGATAEPIPVSHLKELCEVMDDDDWQSKDSAFLIPMFEVAEERPHLFDTFVAFSNAIYFRTMFVGHEELTAWLGAEMGLADLPARIRDEMVTDEDLEAAQDLNEVAVSERQMQMTYRLCALAAAAD